MRKKNIFLYHRQINKYEFLKRILRRSLIYNNNKIGPKNDPCGTPDFTIELFEK